MNRYGPFNWILLVLSSLILLFLLAPLLGLFLQTGANEFFETAKDKEVQGSIWLTIWVSFSATFFFAIAAVPFSWLLARKSFPLKGIVQGLIDLPVVLPHTAAGIALLGFISRDGLLGKAASSIGINLVNNPAGIALAMAFVSLPFLINSARDGFAAVPERLEKAALNLGAGRARVFFTISLPLAWRSIITGFVAPVLIYDRFTSFGLSYARPAAVLFIIVALIVFTALRLLSDRRKSVVTKREYADS
jgi:molybdate/tungstate transport system permease protein